MLSNMQMLMIENKVLPKETFILIDIPNQAYKNLTKTLPKYTLK